MSNSSPNPAPAANDCGPQAEPSSVRKAADGQPTQRGTVVSHHVLLVCGAMAIGLMAMLFLKPELADHWRRGAAAAPMSSAQVELLAANTTMASTGRAGSMAFPLSQSSRQLLTPPSLTIPNPPVRTATTPVDNTLQQQWVSKWLSKRYRVAQDAAHMMVTTSYATAREMQLDPLLILAVMAIESGFNPVAESPGGAQGLMQVMSSVHQEKFQKLGGVQAALNPVANIKVGSSILKEYLTRGGSIEAGLKMYVGAAAFDTDYGYGARVLAEYRRLKDVAIGKKVAISRVARSSVKPKTAAPVLEASSEEPESDRLYQPAQQSRLDTPTAAGSDIAAL